MNDPEAPMGDPTDSQLADLVRAAASVAVPEAARAAVSGAERPEAGPRPGELWRARPADGGPVTLVWIRSVDPSGPVVVPVTFDVEQADEMTLIVNADVSPLGLSLALHLAVETTIEPAALFDRLGRLDAGADVEAVHEAGRSAGVVPAGALAVGPSLLSPLDERAEFRQGLADRLSELTPGDLGLGDAPDAVVAPVGGGVGSDAVVATVGRGADGGPDAAIGEWWPLETPTDRAELLKAIHRVLAESHPGARIAPRPAAAAGSEQLSAVALVAELDAFVLVAVVDETLDDAGRLEAARQALHADQLLNAVCLTETRGPFLAVVVDRRDVVAAIETPSGRLAPARQSRPAAPVGTALSKFLDSTISPFGRLVSTYVEGHAPDPRMLAVDVSADAVRTIEASARSFKTEGKRPGYERVKRHQAAITRLVEEALNRPDVDVAALLEEPPEEPA